MLTTGVVAHSFAPFLWQHWQQCDSEGSQKTELTHLKTSLFAVSLVQFWLTALILGPSPGSPQPQEGACWHTGRNTMPGREGKVTCLSVQRPVTSQGLRECETTAQASKIFPVYMKINITDALSWVESPMRSYILIAARVRWEKSRYEPYGSSQRKKMN